MCCVYVYLLDVPKQPTCMNGCYRELHQQLQSRLGARRQNGTRASAHVTFQRTTSERKLCFSAKLRRQRCCLAELCLQGILPACRPIHWPRPGARVSKKRTRASAHIKWLFSTKQVVSPVFTSATGAAFLVCAHVSNAGPRSRDSVLIASDSAR